MFVLFLLKSTPKTHREKIYHRRKKMFDEVPEQFHQFIGASSTTARTTTTTTTAAATSLLLPLSFTNSSNGFTSFDPLFSSSNSHHQVPTQLHHHHHHHHHQHQFLQSLHQQKNNEDSMVGMNMEINERDHHQRSMAEQIDNLHQPWSNEEILALLRVRSSMENWFPDFTWEHVSRKLAELGFKRSAEKCKEKFEEESRYFNTINCSKNYRIFSELEQLCQAENPPHPHPQHHHQQAAVVAVAEENNKKSREDEDNIGQNLEDDSRNVDELYQTSPENNTAMSSDQDNKNVVHNKANDANNNTNNNNRKKRKRSVKKLEMFKGFCEDIVNKLMIQQEEMHNKMLEDIVKRDEEKVASEEAWKKQELDKLNQELELRVKEQTVAGDRQATIIKFLTKFSQNGSSKKQCFEKVNEEDLVLKLPNECSNPHTPAASSRNPNPIIINDQTDQNPNPKTPISSSSASQNPSNQPTSPLMVINQASQNPTSNEKEDLGKRWPRDEVLALINLRCSLYNNGDNDHKEGATIKAPLWERISQRMLELGYKRSAKRCKEKWENINKYFRKTKDGNKKRSLDSRTCPYFHQLSTLYNQGTAIAPSEGPENSPGLPETGNNSAVGDMVQVPGFEFEF